MYRTCSIWTKQTDTMYRIVMARLSVSAGTLCYVGVHFSETIKVNPLEILNSCLLSEVES